MRFYPALLFAAVIFAAAGCHPKDADPSSGGGTHTLKALGIKDTKVGTGKAIENGDDAWVMYKGKLTNGTVFDTNEKEGGEPFHLNVGQGTVIKGWDQGLIGMKEGGIRELSIPAELAYKDQAKGNTIPANSDLYFEIKLTRLMKKEDADTITIKDIKKGTGAEAKDGSTVHITAQLYAGDTLFEDPSNVKNPIIFKIGDKKMAIEGFDQCIVGMKVGGVREVTIPPKFAVALRNEKIAQNFVRADITLVSVK